MNRSQFLKHVRAQCKKHGVKLVLEKKPRIVDVDTTYEGFFEPGSNNNPPVLTVAIGRPYEDWIEVLAHEYCHMLQWIDKSPLFFDTQVHGVVEAAQLRDLWLDHKIELTEKQLHKYTMVLVKMEVDCEKRVLKLIKKYNLEIDIKRYCQKSNVFLLMYHAMKKSRRYPRASRFESQGVIDLMPPNFRISYDSPPKHLVDTIYNYSFKHLNK